jgi:D-serine deaminase-like pyridoxal phosphate-dependent protein
LDALRIDELDTPSLTVDLDVFESNLRLCMRRLARVHVRPHLKTAKSPDVARRVTLAPSHIDTTVNLHDVLHAHRGGQIEAPGWSPPAARCSRPLAPAGARSARAPATVELRW